MIRVANILGNRTDPSLATQLRDLNGRGLLDVVRLAGDDVFRHRLRVTSEGGRDIAISLARGEHIYDGAVLCFEPDFAVVAEVDAARWLRITPTSKADGLLIGHQAGHLHWKVRFDGEDLLVLLETPVQEYVDRLRVHLDDSHFAVTEMSEVPCA